MNNATITGVITNLWNLSEGVYLGRIHSLEDDNYYYLFWDSNNFSNMELINKYIVARGKLEYIKVRKEKDSDVRRILAINVGGMEMYDF